VRENGTFLKCRKSGTDWEYISPGGDEIYRPKSIIIITISLITE